MGLRGPRPTPSAVKHARGTYRADRAAGNEAVPLGLPKVSTWLRQYPDAVKEFRRLVKELAALGLAGSIDANALTRYCVLWVRWRQAEDAIKRDGYVIEVKGKDGEVKTVIPSPYVGIARSLSEQLDRLEQSFGMNPSARSRIDVTPPAPTDAPVDKSRFFSPMRIA